MTKGYTLQCYLVTLFYASEACSDYPSYAPIKNGAAAPIFIGLLSIGFIAAVSSWQ